MRPALLPAVLPLVLLPLLGAAPATASPTPAPAPATDEPAPADPCAPVDGEVPLMCQGGPTVEETGPDRLPLTGAPAGTAVVGLGVVGVALVLRRRARVLSA